MSPEAIHNNTSEAIKKPSVEELRERFFMYRYFIDSILAGQFSEIPPAEMDQMIEKNFFDFEPLTSLSKKQEELLHEPILSRLQSVLNGNRLKILCGRLSYDGKTIYCKDTLSDDFLDARDAKAMANAKDLSPEEKLALFFNSDSWQKIRVRNANTEGPLTYYGNRGLLDPDGYFNDENEFKGILQQVRQRSGKSKLKILDVGCGTGKALGDMKKIDSNLETHGLTMEQEPGMHHADFFHYMAAERMPKSFEGQFDVIVSNMSFRYYLFQHIALRNVIRSLAVGGYAQISLDYDRMVDIPASRAYFKKRIPEAKNSQDAMEHLIGKELQKLKKLEEQGKIKITASPQFYKYAAGFLQIEKISNITDADFDD